MLQTDRIQLVPLDVSEITDTHVAWLNDPATFRFLGTKFGQTRSSVHKFVESMSPPNVLAKILVKPDLTHVGNIALHMFDSIHRRMELGAIIGEASARNKGVAGDACRLLTEFGFDHLNLHKVTGGVVAENGGSLKMILGIGFRVEGELREHFFLEGRYVNVVRVSMLRSEYEALKGRE